MLFSVTTSALPEGANWICAAPVPVKDWAEPAIVLNFPSSERKPAMLLLVAFTT